jgi:hypothetical protein
MGTEHVRKQSCGNFEQNARRQNGAHQERRSRMLIAIVLDEPLAEAQALVDDPDAFMLAITNIIQNKHAHPVIAQMLHADVRDDFPPSECATAPSEGQSSHTVTTNRTQSQRNFNKYYT